MSLYILPDNQTLIWDSISKVPTFHHLGQNKEIWFQNIIRQFYNSSSFTGNKMTVDELRKMNRETISYMIKVLKNPTFSNNTNSFNQNTFLDSNTHETHNYISEQNQGYINQQFESRQKEYASLVAKPTVTEINFKEPTDDKPIDNMDELLQKQMQERDYDIQILPLATQPVTQPVTQIDSNSINNTYQKSEMDLIKNELQLLRTEVNELKSQLNLNMGSNIDEKTNSNVVAIQN